MLPLHHIQHKQDAMFCAPGVGIEPTSSASRTVLYHQSYPGKVFAVDILKISRCMFKRPRDVKDLNLLTSSFAEIFVIHL